MKLNAISLSIILFAITILPACSNILMIGTAAFITTTTWKDPRTIGVQLDDKVLETYITYTLNKNKNIKKKQELSIQYIKEMSY